MFWVNPIVAITPLQVETSDQYTLEFVGKIGIQCLLQYMDMTIP